MRRLCSDLQSNFRITNPLAFIQLATTHAILADSPLISSLSGIDLPPFQFIGYRTIDAKAHRRPGPALSRRLWQAPSLYRPIARPSRTQYFTVRASVIRESPLPPTLEELSRSSNLQYPLDVNIHPTNPSTSRRQLQITSSTIPTNHTLQGSFIHSQS